MHFDDLISEEKLFYYLRLPHYSSPILQDGSIQARHECPVVLAKHYFAATGDPANYSLPVVSGLESATQVLKPSVNPLSHTCTGEILQEDQYPIAIDISKCCLHSLTCPH